MSPENKKILLEVACEIRELKVMMLGAAETVREGVLRIESKESSRSVTPFQYIHSKPAPHDVEARLAALEQDVSTLKLNAKLM